MRTRHGIRDTRNSDENMLHSSAPAASGQLPVAMGRACRADVQPPGSAAPEQRHTIKLAIDAICHSAYTVATLVLSISSASVGLDVDLTMCIANSCYDRE